MALDQTEIDQHIQDNIDAHGALDTLVDVGSGTVDLAEPNAPAPPDSTRTRPISRVLDIVDMATSARSLFCQYYNRYPETTINLNPTGALLPRQARHAFARFWCGDEPNAPPPQFPESPFEGGQCDGVRYNFVVSTTSLSLDCSSAGGADGFSARLWGPITGVQPLGARSCPSGTAGAGDSGFQGYAVTCRGSAAGSTPIGPPGQVINVAASGPIYSFNNAVISVSRVDGQPDSCGNPPPDFGGGPVPPLPWEGDFNPPGAPDAGWDGFPLNPDFSIGPDGIRLCFDTPVGRACFSYDGLTPEPSDGEQPAPSPPTPDDTATDPDTTPPDYPPDLPPEDAPDDETERIIRGVIVTAVGSGVATQIFQTGGNPDVLAPYCGLVSFKIKTGDGVTAWTEDLRVKNERCFIPCPWQYGAVNVKGTPGPGYSLTLTPVYDVASLVPAPST